MANLLKTYTWLNALSHYIKIKFSIRQERELPIHSVQSPRKIITQGVKLVHKLFFFSVLQQVLKL